MKRFCNEKLKLKQNDGCKQLIKEKDSSRKIPIVYSKHYSVHFWGLEKLHPFDSAKGKHIIKLLVNDNFLWEGAYYEPEEISKEDLLKVHSKKYLKSLKWSFNAAMIAEIPPLFLVPNRFVQRGYLRPMRYQTNGSILAAKLALDTGWAINLGGGFHHCSSHKGGGFCAYADITLLIKIVLEKAPNINKIMIVDLDAHQGNGHERDFEDNDRVFIFDMYNASIYPRDHNAKLSINCSVELLPRTGDDIYLRKLKSNLNRSLKEFHPDFVVYNAGTDVLKGDPLGALSITHHGVIERDEFVFRTARELKIPIVMLLSGGYLNGGYNRGSANVIADSILNLNAKGLLEF